MSHKREEGGFRGCVTIYKFFECFLHFLLQGRRMRFEKRRLLRGILCKRHLLTQDDVLQFSLELVS